MIKEIPEKAKHSRFTDGIIIQHTGNFSMYIGTGPHFSFHDCSPQCLIRPDVTKSMIYRQTQFPVPEHYPTVLVWFTLLGKFGTKKGIPVQKDCRKTHKYTVFAANLIDRTLHDFQVFHGLLF